MKLTKEYIASIGATCTPGYRYALEHNLIGMEWDDAIAYCEQHNSEWADWGKRQKTTESYVRANGSKIIMGKSFQVFNPITGTHTEYPSEAAAREAIVVISQDILKQHSIRLVQSISNENGDQAWIPTTLSQPVVIR